MIDIKIIWNEKGGFNVANKQQAEAYCTCPTEEDFKKDARVMHKYTSYRRVQADEEGICVDCGHYVRWGYSSPKYSKPSWDACHSNATLNNKHYHWDLGMYKCSINSKSNMNKHIWRSTKWF